ncbi:hypothetical protein RvY_19082, partial [Ramazzottius varieornatus]
PPCAYLAYGDGRDEYNKFLDLSKKPRIAKTPKSKLPVEHQLPEFVSPLIRELFEALMQRNVVLDSEGKTGKTAHSIHTRTKTFSLLWLSMY